MNVIAPRIVTKIARITNQLSKIRGQYSSTKRGQQSSMITSIIANKKLPIRPNS